MPRIKGSWRAGERRRTQRAVVISARGSSGAGSSSVPCGDPHGCGEPKEWGAVDPGAVLQGMLRSAEPWAMATLLCPHLHPHPHRCPGHAGAQLPALPPEPAWQPWGPRAVQIKGGNANTSPALASQLSEALSASGTHSSPALSCRHGCPLPPSITIHPMYTFPSFPSIFPPSLCILGAFWATPWPPPHLAAGSASQPLPWWGWHLRGIWG